MLIKENVLNSNSTNNPKSIMYLRYLGVDVDNSGIVTVNIENKSYGIKIRFENLNIYSSNIVGKISLLYEDYPVISELFNCKKDNFLEKVFYPFVRRSALVFDRVDNVNKFITDPRNFGDMLRSLTLNMFNDKLDIGHDLKICLLAILVRIYLSMNRDK